MNYLQRLGLFAFKNKWTIIIGWVVLLICVGITASYFMKPTTSDISIPGTQAQVALDRFGELFPDAGRGTGRVVFAAPSGKVISDFKTVIEAANTKFGAIDGIAQSISPFTNPAALSKDEKIAYIQLQLKGEGGSLDDDMLASIQQTVSDARVDGLTVEMGGDVINKAPGEILGVGEVAGVVVALLVLLMTLGSLISAGMPIITALLTIGVSMAGLFSLSQVIEISSTTPVLGVMLGLAVGIDYSLFIISKYRHYLLEGFSYEEAAGKAIATAGNAVLFAAATVVIALSALAIVNIPFMTTMGLAGAATVALAGIVAVTLVPALLGIAGSKIFRGKTKERIDAAQAKGPHESHNANHATFWYRWGRAVTKRPITVLVVAVLAMAVIALPARDLTLGLPIDQYAAEDTTQRKAYDLLTQGFGVGFNGPLLVVVEGLPAVTDADRQATKTQLLASSSPNTQPLTAEQQLAAKATLQQKVDQYAPLYQLNVVAKRIAALDNVQQSLGVLATPDGTKGVIQVTPKTAPSDSKTIDLITYLRSTDNQAKLGGTNSLTLAVTGSTALQTDINSKLSNALPQYLIVVVGLSLVLLIVAFRSLFIPLKATLGFLLSVAAMFGALVVVFQWGWLGIAEAPGPIISFIPIIAIGILFGLAMDYEFFLVSSMHESYRATGDARLAVRDGFGLGSKVVTAAGVIMVSVFAGFITNHDVTIQAIGFGLAIGILLDAFVVRMSIVPAIMTLVGKVAWWIPKWLDRVLPHISIEGGVEADERKSRS
jgi:RND superfamily putative drug exporter